jgi:hypothetical protein
MPYAVSDGAGFTTRSRAAGRPSSCTLALRARFPIGTASAMSTRAKERTVLFFLTLAAMGRATSRTSRRPMHQRSGSPTSSPSWTSYTSSGPITWGTRRGVGLDSNWQRGLPSDSSPWPWAEATLSPSRPVCPGRWRRCARGWRPSRRPSSARMGPYRQKCGRSGSRTMPRPCSPRE